MCNAAGHDWGCDCGFGGDTGGGGAWRLRYNAVVGGERYSGGWHSDTDGTVESYVNPNANCPVCGQPVFFYRSPYNGRVYFNSLGWPWPKHPCTDRSGEPKRRLGQNFDPRRATPWKSEGWIPLLASKVHSVRDHLLITGDADGQFIELRLPRTYRVDRTSPIFIRPRDQFTGILDVTFLRSDGFGVQPQRTVAFESKFSQFNDELLLAALRGEPSSCAAIGIYLLQEMDMPNAAIPYLLRAIDSGDEDALLTLLTLSLFKQ